MKHPPDSVLDQVPRHEEALCRLVSGLDVAAAVVETDGGVAREKRVKIEPGELGNRRVCLLDRAVVDVLQHHFATGEDRVAREEVASFPALQQIRGVAVAVPLRFKDLQLKVPN